MSKKGKRALASATLMSLVLTTALSAVPVKAAAGEATRTSGADRYATAAQVATKNWDKSETVVLVSGEGYADAVSASALAKKLNAPILLTEAKSLNADTKKALSDLGAKNIYVVGGDASVSAAVRAGLKADGYKLTELGGANRYETNSAVAEELVKLGVDPANVIMVGGEGFSDALSVAPIAAAKGQILLLGMNDANYMSPVVNFVKKHNSKVTVVGTKNVINEAIYSAVGATSRVDGGSDRWDTNQKVLTAFKDTVKFDKLYVASAAYNAQDNGYADALVASALAGKYAAPLVLVDKDGATGTTNALAYIKANASKKTDLNVVGGTGVVSDAILKAVTQAVNPTPVQTGDNTVASVNPINLNQFDVVFNTTVDEDTAELASNYKVAGIDLHDDYTDANGTTVKANAHAELINDNTVRVTLVNDAFKIGQGNEKTVSVKKGILTADKVKTIEKFDKKVEFKDITAPTLKSASIRGNNKLVIEFSEAVNMTDESALKSLIQVNGKSLSSVDLTVKEAATNGVETWASKVEIYFNSGLNSGENTIKVKDTTGNTLKDAAGFTFKEETKTVTVDAVTTAPTVKEITATDDGEIRVKFDRAMDSKAAVKAGYYSINDKAISTAKFELKEDDTVVKITGIDSGILKDNANVLEVKKDVKDAYGNKLADDTRVTFNKEKDETKPTVVSANILDSKTLRIQFSEDVNSAYATNLDNYELRDAYNVDLMTKGGVVIKAAGAETGNTDTYDITFGNGGNATNLLNGSKYTLSVKNIVDIATEPNKMDDYTVALDGNDDQSPVVQEVFLKDYSDAAADRTEVAIFFNKEMDQASISNKANYYYINGSGETKDLPEDADITVSADNKGVVIDFEDANKSIDPTATSGDDKVKQIGVKNLKDASGNELYGGALTIAAKPSTTLSVQDKTLKMYKDGDDVKAEFQLDTALDSIDAADFALTSADGTKVVAASDADFSGKTVILTFKDTDVTVDGVTTNAAEDAEALGVNAKLAVKATGSEDIAGRKINTELTANQTLVQYNAIAPETDRDGYTSTLTVDGTAVTGAVVNITMKTPVDTEIKDSYKDDFVFISNGAKLNVSGVEVVGNTLVFTINSTTIKAGNSIEVTTATDDSKIDIRTAKDGDGKHIKFVPSNDDKKVKSVVVK
ncbi:cell wall-binding repeat-containing protein [Clostridium sp. A1-XYC3]|uniref:Cell wall-binding repeat-containing protein n=1 Tax=Clostridium tanneri TaxID=3037988 RepID=A0ABU4JWP3_9CLOT|nr:cell wall-binding repeat-containing protein [Clostridium sp. A1-XYC3]MDW8802580.1 cell wall-binding repeat-containing protein [Clostridium sp. A1-XYC3]